MVETKTCSRCRSEKPLEQFYTNKRTKDGKTSACSQCLKLGSAISKKKAKGKEKTPEQRERDAARYRIRQRAYYERSRERALAYGKKYYAENRAKAIEYNREYQSKYQSGLLDDDIKLERQLRRDAEEWSDNILGKHLAGNGE